MKDTINCADVQDQVLRRVDGLPDESNVLSSAAIDAHLEQCAECAAFAERQLELDRRLSLAMPPMKVGADFPAAVRRRIAAEPKQPWTIVLPDYAHLVGCAAATCVTVALFPAYASLIVTVGTITAACTYLAQTMLAGALDEMDERRQPVRE
jgi:hypothetical protein